MTEREKERQRKLNKKPSVSEARKNIEAKRKSAVKANKKSKSSSEKTRSKADRNPFNVRSAAQKVMDRRYRNQTTDSNQ